MNNDLISRQQALEIKFSNGMVRRGVVYVRADELVNKLKELPSAEPKQQWIPCSERLPDVAQRVLLSGHGMVMIGMLHSFGKYSLEPTGISYAYSKDDIEAWMPLPEPYVRGEQNDSISD